MSNEERQMESVENTGCTHDCSSCQSKGSCGDPASFIEPTHRLNNIGKVIGVVSGKGGVGKSSVTSLLASNMRRRGYNVGILDADITGPSIPKAFGLTQKAYANEEGMFPVKTKTGISAMSINVLLEEDTEPVVWRGPVIAGVVKQFWTDVIWGDIDYLFVDMPPGTGDVPLTVFQSLPIDGIVVVTSPQDLVSMVVAKAINMASMMNVPVLGLVENYSYVECPDCGTKISVFGESKVDAVGEEYGIEVLAKMPIDPELAKACDAGTVEDFENDWLDKAVDKLSNL